MATSNQLFNAVSVRLDDTNYPTWHFLMQHYLRGLGLLKFVNGSYPCPPLFQRADHDSLSVDNTEAYEKWLQQDSSVICLIITSLSADALTLVVGCQTSMEVWLTLKQRYATVSEFHIMQLKSNLQAIRKGSDSIDKYLLRFKHVRNQLAAIDVSMSDEDIKPLILAGLPSEYAHTRQMIRSKNSITMEEVRCLLLSAEFELKVEHKAHHLSPFTAMIAHNGVSNPGYQNMQYGLPNRIAKAHELLSSPYLRNCVVSAPMHHSVNMVPGVSSVPHYNTSPTVSTTHFGNALPQKSMSSSSGFAIPNVPANCQSSYNCGVLSPISGAPSAPNPRYVLNNGIGNDILAGTFSQTPQVAKKQTALCDVTNESNGSQIGSRSSASLSKPMVPCTTKVVMKTIKETSTLNSNHGLSGNVFPASLSSKSSILVPFSDTSVSGTVESIETVVTNHSPSSKGTVFPAPSSIIHPLKNKDVSPSRSVSGSVSLDETISTSNSLKSPEFEYVGNEKRNSLYITDIPQIEGIIRKRNILLDTSLKHGTWKLPYILPDRPLLNCRQACQSMELWQSPLLISPG